MMEELIARVFATRNAVHLAHWAEKSGFRHEVLGDLYESLIETLDPLVEAHQGLIGLVKVGDLPAQPKVSKIVPHLEADLEWIAQNRAKITDKVPAIDNLLQDMEAHYLHSIYKLNNLS
jgi:hypothetical protein